MSITRTYSVFCDRDSSPSCHGWVAQTTDGATAARQLAREAGWKRIDNQDICPACQGDDARKEQG